MNKQRRERLSKLISQAEEMSAELEAIRDEEQEAFDNMPENMQGGERGDKMQEAIEAMDTAITSLEDFNGQLGGLNDE